ncbi:aryl-sulfate sulfotransferase [Maribacter sp. CXY002]|uniref:aryl-sulfate sulfotransferase n=1 Tax=Maribacter luteocoastalis TaxID=3407671 RepID=UPI003B670F9B
MKNNKFKKHIFLLVTFAIILSCETTLEPNSIIEEEDNIDNPPIVEEETESIEDTITYYNESKVSDGLILINDAAANKVFLMNRNGKTVFDWPLGEERLGNDAHLLPNGKLLAMLEVPDPKIQLGGFGGKVEIINKKGEKEWSFTYASDNHILHHDAQMLPNGNILTMIWERKSIEESQEAGYSLNVETFPDGLIEIDTTTNTIVWEWHVWDHLIQENDNTKSNFGEVATNPQLIDINYTTDISGDITHGNGIAYDPEKDVIYFSSNFYSEIWVIDHSTTSEQAASSSGGTYNKGGDLIYRFGNPSAYKNQIGKRLFNNNHFPNLLKEKNTILVYSNGGDLNRSTVYELELASEFSLTPNADNEPQVVWTFSNEKLFSPKVSGAVELPNGNILITEGDFGLWEVTKEKEIIWQYEKNGFYWRAYHYSEQDESIINLSL